MSASLILDRVEKMLTALGVRDRFGDPCEGLEAGAFVAQRADPGRWALAWKRWGDRELSDEEFVAEVAACIEQARRVKSRATIERALANAKRGAG